MKCAIDDRGADIIDEFNDEVLVMDGAQSIGKKFAATVQVT